MDRILYRVHPQTWGEIVQTCPNDDGSSSDVYVSEDDAGATRSESAVAEHQNEDDAKLREVFQKDVEDCIGLIGFRLQRSFNQTISTTMHIYESASWS